MELLKKQNNTRNFSHITTQSGRSIRPDIIRSNILSNKEQTSILLTNEIKTIIDFRISEEGGGSKNPTYLNTTVKHLPISFGNLGFEKINKMLLTGNVDSINVFIQSGYQTFSTDFKDEIRSFFALLINEENLPIVFHCTAGKDRTGILTGLFLIALGVENSTVMDDYIETNNLINSKEIIDYFTKSSQFSKLTHPEKSIQILEILFTVNIDWLDIFFLSINENFGSVEIYLKNEIGVDIKKLQDIYLAVKPC